MTAREVLALTRPARRLWTPTDLYVLAFGLVLGGATGMSLAAQIEPLPASSAPVVSAWLVGGVTALTATVSWLLGPMAAPAALSSWVLASPIDRRRLLVPRAFRVLGAALAVGIVGAGLGWLMLGAGNLPSLAAVILTSLVTTSCTLAAQVIDGLPTLAALVPGGLAALALIAWWPLVAAAVLLLGGAIALVASWHHLGSIDRFRLARAAGHGDSVTGAVMSGHGALLLDVLAGRAHRTGVLLPGRGTGGSALAWIDLQRVLRRSPALVVLLAVAAASAGLATASLPLLCLVSGVQVVVLGASMGMLRGLLRGAGLRRALALSPRWGIVAPAVLCGAAFVVASLVGWPTAGAGGLVTHAAIQLLALAGGLRLSAGSAPNFSTGVVMTEAGPVAAGAMMAAARGWDVWALGCGALLLGAPPVSVMAGAAFVLRQETRRLPR